MAKLDKSRYSKEEYRRLKAQEKANKRALKAGAPIEQVKVKDPVPDNNYILCVKHGTKYSADYVNKLYNMVSRNCNLKFELVRFPIIIYIYII